jgi:hypothetical protein
MQPVGSAARRVPLPGVGNLHGGESNGEVVARPLARPLSPRPATVAQ